MSDAATDSDGSERRDRSWRDRYHAAGQVASMSGPASNEVLESRVQRLEVEQARDREEMMSRIVSGFAEVKADIAGLTFVHPDVFTAWQKATEARFDKLDAEVVWNRRLLAGSVGGAIVVFVTVAATGVSI